MTKACRDCASPVTEHYMVHDELWNELTTQEERQLHPLLLCLDCLTARLGRFPTEKDFTDAAINHNVRTCLFNGWKLHQPSHLRRMKA